LYILIGGTVQMWEQSTIELLEMNYHNAPDFMVDFALRSDGGLLLVSINDDIETLSFCEQSGQSYPQRQRFSHGNRRRGIVAAPNRFSRDSHRD
jgi:hypothetical protein